MKFSKQIPAALVGVSLTFGVSACFHDDTDDDHHDSSISVHIHEEEVVVASGRNEDSVEGTATLEFHETEKELKGSVIFTGTVAPDRLHIHSGFAGQTGGVVITLDESTTAGTWVIPEAEETLTDEEIEILEAGGYYLNAHFPDETTIRGQIAFGDVTYVVSDLAAAKDANDATISTTGTGFAGITVNTATRAVASYVTVENLASGNLAENVHIHYDNVNETTLVPVTLTKTADTPITFSNDNGTTDDNDTLTVEGFVEGNHGRWYINVHTTANPNGELRADFGVFPTHSH